MVVLWIHFLCIESSSASLNAVHENQSIIRSIGIPIVHPVPQAKHPKKITARKGRPFLKLMQTLHASCINWTKYCRISHDESTAKIFLSNLSYLEWISWAPVSKLLQEAGKSVGPRAKPEPNINRYLRSESDTCQLLGRHSWLDTRAKNIQTAILLKLFGPKPH